MTTPTARRELWRAMRAEKNSARVLVEEGGEANNGRDGVWGAAEEGAGETSPGWGRESKKKTAAATGDHPDHDFCGPSPEHVTCMTLLKHDCTARRVSKHPHAGDPNLWASHGRWQSAQRAAVSRMEKQLQSRWALDEQIEAHLALLDAHYSGSMLPGRPRDVAHLIMPQWKPPIENAATSWLGDWRPSAILSLVPRVVAAPVSPRAHRYLSEAIRRLRIEEAVIDEQVAERQSTCLLVLLASNDDWGHSRRERMPSILSPPSTTAWRRGRGGERMLRRVVEEVRKVECAVGRAQRLRYRAVEVAVRQVLDRAQAAEFLVAFTGVQESVHLMATRWRKTVGPVHVAVQQAIPTAHAAN